MSHFFVAAIVPSGTENIEDFITNNMSRYDENKEIEPYKEEVDHVPMIEFYKVHNIKELVKKVKDWNGNEGFIEDEKLYCMNTYNPDSTWDWYRIGGRWDGVIQKIERLSEDRGFNFNDDHQQLVNNVTTTEKFIIDEITAFAVLTPEGEWIENDNKSYNIVDKSKRLAELKIIMEKYPDHQVVGLDCHV